MITKQDILRVIEYLRDYGYKDTDFQKALSLNGDEILTVVQNNVNKQITIEDLRVVLGQGTYNQYIYNPGSLYEGTEEPEDKEVLWLDTSTIQNKAESKDLTLASIQQALYELERKVEAVSLLRTNGAVAGKVTDSTLNEISKISDPLKPSVLEDDDDDDSTTYPDVASESSKTLNHISIKCGTFEEMKANIRNFIENELCWCTTNLKMYIYYNNAFYPIGGTSSNNNNEEQIMKKEELQTLLNGGIDSINFTDINGENKYVVKVNRYGNLQVYDKSLDVALSEPNSNGIFLQFDDVGKDGTYNSIQINSFYLGGSDKDEHSYQPCSHNFVELSNISSKDISINGLILLYTFDGVNFEKLPLKGIVPAHSTFLVRGAQCSVMDVNTTKIKVKTFDMEWYDDNNNLVKFNRSSNNASFYLCWGNDEGKIYQYTKSGATITNSLVDKPTAGGNLINTDDAEVARGYEDMVGVGTLSFREKNPIELANVNLSDNYLFVRWYSLDPVSQSNPKSIDKRNNKKYWKFIDLTGRLIDDVTVYTPKASWEGKSAATDKTKFSATEPNCFTCNFGIQASDDTANSGKGATRCFTWTSIDYFDEYIAYRKQGETEWRFQESYKPGVDYTVSPYNVNQPDCITSTTNNLSEYYYRKRWETFYGEPVTTHKVMITNLTSGVYEYMSCRKNSDGTISDYRSKIRKFTVRSYNDCKDFKFIQTTDQQGANWEEYQVWVMSAAYIAKTEENFDFTINTGDIVYNGSRPNEWLDYYEGYKYLDDKEENFAVGNNDLAPYTMSILGTGSETPDKSSHVVADLFYTQEMDINNPPIFEGVGVSWTLTDSGWKMTEGVTTKQFRIPCLYSFNYGPWHFISLNSEIRTCNTTTSPNTVTGDSGDGGEFGVKDEYRSSVGTEGDANTKASTDPIMASKVYDYIEAWMLKDILQWKAKTDSSVEVPEEKGMELVERREELRYLPQNCGRCIIYTHEAPFTIIAQKTYAAYAANPTQNNWRETGKANLNRKHLFEFQRLFKIWGISCLFGGHKHTCSISYPVYDAPAEYNPIDSEKNTNDVLMGLMKATDTFNPITQLAIGASDFDTRLAQFISGDNNQQTIINNTDTGILGFDVIYNNTESTTVEINGTQVAPKTAYTNHINENSAPMCKLEIVDKITAPTYVMSQATGYKIMSNSDTMANVNNGWLKHSVPQGGVAQCYPFYTVIECSDTDSKINIKLNRVKGLNTDGADKPSSKAGYWDANKMFSHIENGKETITTFEEGKEYLLSKLTGDTWGNVELNIN